jgi:23S rRNA maturation mini-RNase III
VRVAMRGDFPIDRLDAIKAAVVRAERQAALLEAILGALDEHEASVVRRARNTAPPSSARGRRSMQCYRAASALEALVAAWSTSAAGLARLEEILGPPLEAAIDEAVAALSKRTRRG